MRNLDIPFIPGIIPSNRGPLARFYPPVPSGAATTWLNGKITPGSVVLDPFGSSPSLVLEMARQGYRILVTVNNPITGFYIETLACAPHQEDLRAAFADLAASKKGEERLEPFIQALYTIECPGCGRPIQAKAFIWQRQAETPERCLIDCPHCGLTGEHPVNPSKLERLAALTNRAGHTRARALERVAPLDDPIRPDVEQALQCYLPRPLFVLFTILNRIESLQLTPERQRWLTALMLTVCDESNTLWPYPVIRHRPRQLIVPALFKENNLWMALEQSVNEWQTDETPVPVTHWPQLPPDTGGICLFQGRIRDLTANLAEYQSKSLSDIPIGAIVSVLPRPNQAFWTLSALWAGWLWGQEAVKPLKSALARQRYDWNWHTTALSSTLSNLTSHIDRSTPFWGFISEVEPAFLSSVIIAGDLSNLHLDGIALRHDLNQAELSWTAVGKEPLPERPAPEISEETAIINHLEKRGEPAPYLVLHAAALTASASQHHFKARGEQKDTALLQEHQAFLQQLFNENNFLVRYGGSQHSLEIGMYWGRRLTHGYPALADQVEKEIVQYLIANPLSRIDVINQHLCQVFPGLFTPPLELVRIILESYGEQQPADSDRWQLNPTEIPSTRREELKTIQEHLRKTGEQLNYTVQGANPLFWIEPDGSVAYEFHPMASAMISRCVISSQASSKKPVITIPGSRANLIIYKLHHDPWLNEKISAGWTFLKFRHLRQLTNMQPLTRPVWEEWLPRDPLELKATQLEMF